MENWRAAFARRKPTAEPVNDHVQVIQDIPPWQAPEILYSEFDSERYGGRGATTRVVSFPGDPPSIAWDFQEHPMAPPRNRARVIGRDVPAAVPQTVSNLRRTQLEQQEAGVVVGPLDIFEGIS